jgi:hypothetical protein
MAQGQQDQDLTCMPKALMATEIGPFLASQAASSEGEGQRQWHVGPALPAWPPSAPYSLCSFWLKSTESLM